MYFLYIVKIVWHQKTFQQKHWWIDVLKCSQSWPTIIAVKIDHQARLDTLGDKCWKSLADDVTPPGHLGYGHSWGSLNIKHRIGWIAFFMPQPQPPKKNKQLQTRHLSHFLRPCECTPQMRCGRGCLGAHKGGQGLPHPSLYLEDYGKLDWWAVPGKHMWSHQETCYCTPRTSYGQPFAYMIQDIYKRRSKYILRKVYDGICIESTQLDIQHLNLETSALGLTGPYWRVGERVLLESYLGQQAQECYFVRIPSCFRFIHLPPGQHAAVSNHRMPPPIRVFEKV